jgi:hypothetical protein
MADIEELPPTFKILLKEASCHVRSHSVTIHSFETEEQRGSFRSPLLLWFDKSQRSMPWRKPEKKISDDDLNTPELGQRAYEGYLKFKCLQSEELMVQFSVG